MTFNYTEHLHINSTEYPQGQTGDYFIISTPIQLNGVYSDKDWEEKFHLRHRKSEPRLSESL